MNESGDAGGGSGGGGGSGSGGVVVVVVEGDDGSGGGRSWWNAGVGINGVFVLEKRADLAATGVTCRDDQCRRGDFRPRKIRDDFLASQNDGDEMSMETRGRGRIRVSKDCETRNPMIIVEDKRGTRRDVYIKTINKIYIGNQI